MLLSLRCRPRGRREGEGMHQLAERLDRLGTETAFAVSAAAAEWASRGNRVFPFHLGDINLPTPANVVDAMNRAIADGKTGYCPAAGIAPLREALAANIGGDRGLDLTAGNIVVQPGGKPVMFYTMLALLEEGDEAIYPNPGFPIYESMIDFVGAKAVPLRLREDRHWSFDVDELASLITPRTKLLVLNSPHNPTGGALDRATLAASRSHPRCAPAGRPMPARLKAESQAASSDRRPSSCPSCSPAVSRAGRNAIVLNAPTAMGHRPSPVQTHGHARRLRPGDVFRIPGWHSIAWT